MFGKLITNILTIPQGAFAGEVVNNQLNPLHLAVATTGYRIQSQTLEIPDRFGFFSPGPPRLQVHQGLSFMILVGWICLPLIFYALLCRLYDLPTAKVLGVAVSLGTVPGVVLFWIVAVNDRHRAPGHEWRNWKLRKD